MIVRAVPLKNLELSPQRDKLSFNLVVLLLYNAYTS